MGSGPGRARCWRPWCRSWSRRAPRSSPSTSSSPSRTAPRSTACCAPCRPTSRPAKCSAWRRSFPTTTRSLPRRSGTRQSSPASDSTSRAGTAPPRRIAGVAHSSGESDVGAVPELIAQFIPQQSGAVKTIDLLEAAAKGNGSVTPDIRTSVVRRVPMLFRLAGQRDEDLYPSLSMETIRVVQGASTYLVRWSGVAGLSIVRRAHRSRRNPGRQRLDRNRLARPHDPVRQRPSAVALRLGARRAERDGTCREARGHIVFVGTSAVGLQDLRATPIEESTPGVEVHAQLVEQVLSQTFLHRPDWADGAEFLYLAASGCCSSCCCRGFGRRGWRLLRRA